MRCLQARDRKRTCRGHSRHTPLYETWPRNRKVRRRVYANASQERTSKQGSLKLNYGGITTKSTRNEKALNRLLDEYEKQQLDRLN